MVRYRYTPLPGNNYIRLATIHPGKFKDDIVVSFQTLPFPGPKYEALSYAWGSKKNPLPVYVSGCDVGTTLALRKICKLRFEKISSTQNLCIALRHLRYVDQPRVMWIDALCIHQADTAEKGPQVVMMGDIFRLAHRVVAWLGPEENDSNHAMALIRYIGLQVEVDYFTHIMSAVDGCPDPELADKNTRLPWNARSYRSVYHLISRQWFQRLWVRQEISLANPEAIVMCGFWQVKWHIFGRALYCIGSKPRLVWEFFGDFNTCLQTISQLILNRSSTSILSLRLHYQNCQCLTPLDRLYAILAILPEHQRALIPFPDYTISYVELYTYVTIRWILCYDLNILGQCDLRDDGPCSSWVPDWTKPSSLPYKTFGHMGWRASSQVQSRCEFRRPRVLRVNGISKTLIKHNYQVPDFDNILDIERFRKLRRLLFKLNRDELNMVKTYARTLVGNLFRDDYDPPLVRFTSLNEAKHILELLLSDYQYNDDDFGVGSVGSNFLAVVASAISGLQLFQTTGGHLGIASESARLGDEICCVLGCEELLLLRPLENGTFKLVGPCRVPELSNGESFLGPLPDNLRPVRVYNKVTGYHEYGFKDVSSGKTTYEDPRLKSLLLDPDDLHSFRKRLDENHWATIYVDPEILRKSGVELRCFDLV
ncbi:HET-domain-containing protein [Hypoxylon rubiginosum]|uniref:HET-domain-containing protein n=1 Tax=Hypoxylon rubiginosum TaxID=110542 RepID=A0ACC0DGD4_9PEZI|nr:HET-domain-containing protein [Hypoxylon rubiginosum]